MKTSEKDLLLPYSENEGSDEDFDMHLSNVEELMVPRNREFDAIKERIRMILLGEDETGEVIKRTVSHSESIEILSQLEQIKQPKFGIRLARGVKVNFMQKFYVENILILGVNRKKVFAFSYKEDRNRIPFDYRLVHSIDLDMQDSYKYMARSKLDNGVMFCSDEEIFSITFDPSKRQLIKTLILDLASVSKVLDTKNGTEKTQHNYTHAQDTTLRFSEAKLFVANSERRHAEVLFLMYSDYNINRNRQLENIDSSLIFLARFENEVHVESKWELVSFIQTLGRASNLTLPRGNKVYYIKKNQILESVMKSLNNQLDKHKSFRVNEFNYEKEIYSDNTHIEQFEFDRHGKHILALMDEKVKKLFKYNKDKIPVYFEQENPVEDFAVSGDFLFTGDLKSTVKIWNPEKNRIINDLNLQVGADVLDEFTSLEGIESDLGIFAEVLEETPEEAFIVDIIVNDDFSELVVIMSDKIIFWQIPFYETVKKVEHDMNQNSSVCFLNDGMTFRLNCGNSVVQRHRSDSLRLLHSLKLPYYTYLVRMIPNGDVFVAYKDRPPKEGKKELTKEEIAAIEAPTVVIRVFGDSSQNKERVLETENVLTSLDVVYKEYLSEAYGATDLPEFAILAVLNQSDLLIIRRDQEGEYQIKNIPRLSVRDPNFMKSIKQTSQPMSPTSKSKTQDIYATEIGTPSHKGHGMDNEDMHRDLIDSFNREEEQVKFGHFEYSRELNYFVGYMTERESAETRLVHFIAFNPFRTRKPKIIIPQIFKENLKRGVRPSKYRVFLERMDTGHYMVGFNSNMGSFFVEINKIDGQVLDSKVIKQPSNAKVSGQMLGDFMYLVLPFQNKLEVFDYESTDRVYTLQTQKNILETYKSGDGRFICVFDSLAMYVVDIEKMIFVQKQSLTNREHQTKMMVLNMPFFFKFREYRLPELIQDVHVLQIININNITGLRYMPVDVLALCFSAKDKHKPLIAFGEFYSETIARTSNIDYIFGPLNPFIFAIFYSDEQTLQHLLENSRFPRWNSEGFFTPLEYTFFRNENDCLRILCNLLLKSRDKIYFTQNEFTNLLESDFEFCHSLISKVPLEIPFKKINLSEVFQEDNAVRYNSSLKNFFLENEKRQFEMEHNPTQEQKEASRERFGIKFVPFRYDFTPGSTESMDFLQYYSDSESDLFVKSHWKTIIHDKWASLKPIYAFNAVIFWIYMFFCTWSISFNLNVSPDGVIIGEQFSEIRYLALAFNILIAFLEVLQMISFCFYRPLLYFGDFWNYIDFIALIFSFLFFISFHEQATQDGSVFIALILMLLIYYRGFSYFRFFDSFTSMIGIINTIVAESLSFFGVMFYTYFVILFLLYRVEPSDQFINKMRDAFIFTFFGGVEQDHFEAKYIFFPIFVGTMIMTIILLNVLIAFMSNVYNKMEQMQSVLSLKEKASMLLDLEVYISLFVKIINRFKTRKLDEEETEEYYQEKAKVTFFMSKIEGLTNSDDPNNEYTKMIRLERDILDLENLATRIGVKSDKQFTSLKKKIKSISKFIGFAHNEKSHFDVKMQSIMRILFEDFTVGVTDNVLETIAEDFNLQRPEHPNKLKKFSLFNFRNSVDES